jgi:predicted amidohydrolase
LPRLQRAATKAGIALQAGTMPWRAGKKNIVNRAWMLFPDRRAVHHDKLALIPSERDRNGWMVTPGETVRVFTWRGARVLILTCLDIEMPALAHKLVAADADLVLVPSFTEKRAGYHRVFGCARMRAVELMTAVAVVGCTGGVPRTHCTGGASVFIPCEEVFGHTGAFAEIPAFDSCAGAGRVLYVQDVPVGAIRAVRHGKPEVWPGAWSADRVKVKRV